jgi:hypothetical protein
MTDREKLIEILRVPIYPHEQADPAEVVADYLLDNGVTFAKDTNVPTNADRIRAMTDKDLAISMFVSIDCSVCPCTGKCSNGSGCLDTILNWLQQPAEVDDAENR